MNEGRPGGRSGPFGIEVFVPGGQRDARVVQGREQGLVQQLIAQAAVEALDEGTRDRRHKT